MAQTPCPPPALIEERLNALSSPIHAAAGGWTVRGPLTCSEFSATYRAACPGSPVLFIKLPRGYGSSAASEYEALRIARERLGGQARLRVPAACSWLLDEGFLVTEWIDAPTIAQLLRSPRALPHSVISAVELAGRWLRAFHGEREQPLVCLDADLLINHASSAINKSNGWRAAPRRFKEYVALLERTKPLLLRVPVRTSLQHGDFKPANVMIAADAAIAFDIANVFVGPMIEDIAHFLLHLELSLFEPSSWRLLPWRSALETAFLRGYDPDRSRIPPLLLAWARLQRVVRHYSVPMESENKRMRGAFRKLCYARCASLNAQVLQTLHNAQDGVSGAIPDRRGS